MGNFVNYKNILYKKQTLDLVVLLVCFHPPEKLTNRESYSDE